MKITHEKTIQFWGFAWTVYDKMIFHDFDLEDIRPTVYFLRSDSFGGLYNLLQLTMNPEPRLYFCKIPFLFGNNSKLSK